MTNRIDSFKETIIKLNEASEKLNEASNNFNNQVSIIEEELNKLNIGIIIYSKQEGFELGYGRIDGKWHLIIKEGDREWPYTSAPRHSRIKAFVYIPNLIIALLSATESLTEDIKKASLGLQFVIEKIKND